ncbi:putative two-component hybrid sensor and regulator [Sphingomonas changbaiensis NBRC 104936]|uniref:histidine kinase n=1 Tax=Sphingomonas changbaiensis NBRC 104936 TaxID=1219043 RepID=A0A0E9MJB3_9SPHN|nr:response regulator [Sphingomonas changbaiensis]GAO37887.1 putative two-component hybrid sensor and regulator [Sphingomonas changbaiensis NBRC 104936]
MNLEALDDLKARPRLFGAARRSIAGPMLAAALVVVVVTALASEFGALAALSSGILTAAVACWILSGAIARLAVEPVELLLDQLDGQDLESFRWRRGQAMTRPQIEGDVKLLRRRIREIMRRSRTMIDELERAREQANHQNLAKSQFLAKMSHELRTPLNAILGYAMLLHEDASEAGESAAMADLDRIQQAGRTLLALINDILDLSKIDAGRMTIERVAIDVQALAAAVASACGAGDPPNGNRFELTVDPGISIMIGDAAKLRRCLINLIGNAFKFTRDGSVALRISPLERGGSSWIEFAVSDTGIGIAPENIGGLFDAFRQLDGSATRQFSGAGLGLSIVQRLAGLMDGNCTVESVVGEGSTFRMLLPLGDSASRTAAAGEKSSESVGMLVKTPSAEHTALVVDDDEATVELMQRWLVRMGYNVVFTNGADNVLELARTHRPDFILLDVLLPGASGYQVLEQLRADPDIGHIPTILITVEDDRARGLRAGATDYLRKPITAQQLRSVLDVYRLRATGEVLVIDDDDDSADLLARSVAQVGFSARRAADGAEGLAMAAEMRPDAIVLDLAMPVMNGFEVLDRLSATEELRDVPLIVVSGCDITIEEHRRLAAAGHRFFPKAASTPREIAQSLKELVL